MAGKAYRLGGNPYPPTEEARPIGTGAQGQKADTYPLAEHTHRFIEDTYRVLENTLIFK